MTLKVGDRVCFKSDIEGDGVIVDIMQEWYGPEEYAVGNWPEPTWERWHPRADVYLKDYDGAVVIVDRDHIHLYEEVE